MNWRAVMSILMISTMVFAGPALAAQEPLPLPLIVSITPLETSVDLGETVDLRVTVKNDSGVRSPDLVVHLDITNADRDGSVDPEDWTPTLNQFAEGLAPSESASVDWTVQPISPGTFTVFAVILANDATNVIGSNTLVVKVADQRSLNPQGILPVSLGIPAGLGLLLAERHRRLRRT